MKPIEPGCKALVVSSKATENIGRTVKVLHRAPTDHVPPELLPLVKRIVPFDPTEVAWVCIPLDDRPLIVKLVTLYKTRSGVLDGPSRAFAVSEARFLDKELMRIDGDPGPAEDIETTSRLPIGATT